MENSDFISSAECTEYCEKAFQEWLGILTAKDPDFLITSASVSLAAGATSSSFAAGYRALRGIRHQSGGGLMLRRAEFSDIERLDWNGRRGKPTHYWISGSYSGANTWKPLPTPDAAYTLTVYYIPTITLADVTGGGLNLAASWDEYVVLTAAMKMKDKEESDVSVLLREREMLREHMIAQLSTQDVGEPPRMNTFQNPFTDPFDIEDRYGY